MRRKQATVGIVLVAAFLSLAFARGALGGAQVNEDVRRYDGESLFKGLFLAEGQVAQHYPDLRVPSAEHPWRPEQAQYLVNLMSRSEPGFFDGFAADITSGDRPRIERAAVSADRLATAVLKAAGSIAGGELQFAGSVVVVNKTVVKQSNVVWNTNRIWATPKDGVTTLARERWVDDVATALNLRPIS